MTPLHNTTRHVKMFQHINLYVNEVLFADGGKLVQ